MGVDAAAHRGALEAGGRTVAVLGCGIDIAYPARNKDLKRQIEARGTVVTEYESGTPGYATNFPERNRIIAALSYGVLIVEGGFKSGALITARRAIDANRLVFAIPGSIRNPLAQGPNELIRAGEASLVTEVKHIFQEMAPQMVWTEAFDPLSRERPRLDPDDETLLLLFDDSPATVDALCRASGMELGRAAVALTRLEVRGFIRDGRAGYELTQSGARTRAAVFETHVPANH
jgi:DNA processing protein